MRVLVTGIAELSGRTVARMLLAAGHEVAGLGRRWDRLVDPRVEFVAGEPTDPAACARAVAGCVSVVHLAGRGYAEIAAAARNADARLLVPLVAGGRSGGSTESEITAVLRGSAADVLLIRTAPVAGRRIGQDTRRALEPILGSRFDNGFQLLHSDDLDRFLVLAATSLPRNRPAAPVRRVAFDSGGAPDRVGATGRFADVSANGRGVSPNAAEQLPVRGDGLTVVELAAPGVITPTELRHRMKAAGVRYSAWVPGWAGRRPLLDPTAVQQNWGFRCGWTAPEVAADVVRGMIGRKADGGGFRTRRGAIPLPAHVIPAHAVTSDGHTPANAASEEPAGEFDDRIDECFPVHTTGSTAEALPGPLTPLTIDLHVGALRLANETTGTMLALDGITLEHWTNRLTAVLGQHVYHNASIGVLAAEHLPGRVAQRIRRNAYANTPDGIALLPHGNPPMPTGMARAFATWRAASRVLSAARRYRTTTECLSAASHTEALTTAQLSGLTDDRLHVQALLWRDRLHQAWQAVSVGALVASVANADRGNTAEIPLEPDSWESAKPLPAVELLAELCRTDPRLYALAANADVDAARAVSPDFAAALDAELANIGHRGPGECELINPTFSDRPELLVLAAARAAQRPAPKREQLTPAPSRMARRAADVILARDRAHDAVARINHCLRLAVRERAARLVHARRLREIDDACYLTLDELFCVPADIGARVERRRAERAGLQQLKMPDVIAGHWEPAASAQAPATRTATTRLSDGRRVRIDGVAGTVTPPADD